MSPVAWEAVVSPFAAPSLDWCAGSRLWRPLFYNKGLCLAALLGTEKSFKDVFQL